MYKILVHGMTGSRGGIESFIMNYYRKINGADIHLDFLCNQKNPYEKELRENGSKIFYLYSKSQHPIKYKKALKSFFKKYASSYDCIWSNESGLANIDYLKLAKKYGIKKRIIHSHTTNNTYFGLLRPVETLMHYKHKNEIDSYATDFWACSQEAGQWLYPEKLFSKIKVIKNAVDISKFSFDPDQRRDIRKSYHLDNNYVIGLVGRMSPEKNQIFMLDVLKRTNQKNVKLVIVGDGPDKEKIIQKAKQLEIYDQIILPGVQDNMQGWYSTFDCYVLPSIFEGQSVSGLEAQANGLPILVSTGAKPKDLKVNSNFFYLNLKQGSKVWAEQLNDIIKNQKRELPCKVLKNFDKANLNLDLTYKKLRKMLVE